MLVSPCAQVSSGSESSRVGQLATAVVLMSGPTQRTPRPPTMTLRLSGPLGRGVEGEQSTWGFDARERRTPRLTTTPRRAGSCMVRFAADRLGGVDSGRCDGVHADACSRVRGAPTRGSALAHQGGRSKLTEGTGTGKLNVATVRSSAVLRAGERVPTRPGAGSGLKRHAEVRGKTAQRPRRVTLSPRRCRDSRLHMESASRFPVKQAPRKREG